MQLNWTKIVETIFENTNVTLDLNNVKEDDILIIVDEDFINDILIFIYSYSVAEHGNKNIYLRIINEKEESIKCFLIVNNIHYLNST